MPPADRIKGLYQDFWLGTPVANKVLTRLESMLQRPAMNRKLSLLVYAEPSTGKTAIARHFQALHAPVMDPGQEANHVPVLLIELARADTAGLYESILDGLHVTQPRYEPLRRLEVRTERQLCALGVRLLLIDEFNNVANGTARESRDCIAALRHIMNKGVSIACFGTDDAKRVVTWDNQLTTRLVYQIRIEPWKFGTDFFRLLMALEKRWPLHHASNMHRSPLAEKFFEMTEGLTGEIIELVRSATALAIESQTECITLELLAKIDWVVPSHRGRGLDTVVSREQSKPKSPPPPVGVA